jgi:hypothetical protein
MRATADAPWLHRRHGQEPRDVTCNFVKTERSEKYINQLSMAEIMITSAGQVETLEGCAGCSCCRARCRVRRRQAEPAGVISLNLCCVLLCRHVMLPDAS